MVLSTFVVLLSVSVLCTSFLITTNAAAAAPVVTVLAGIPIAVSASNTTPTGPNPNPPVPHVAGAAVVPYSHHVLLAITHVVRDSGFSETSSVSLHQSPRFSKVPYFFILFSLSI